MRNFLQPEADGQNWEPFLWISCLCVLFVPLGWEQNAAQLHTWLFPTLLTLPVFLVLYAWNFRLRRRLRLLQLLPMALLAYGLTPVNPAAFTYLAFAAMFAPYALSGLLRPLLVCVALIALLATEIVLIHQPQIPLTIVSAALFITLSCVNGYFRVEGNRKNAALKSSHHEIRRLAAVAERERIGRDLHDLLGHTLSLIAVKSELAGKLMVRDPAAASREIGDVTRTARESLKQMRATVAGLRVTSIQEELNSARTLLESTGIAFSCHRDDAPLLPEAESALAMVVREAATNIHRHAAARRAWIEIRSSSVPHHTPGVDVISLIVGDDGRGGATLQGRGLSGSRERVQALGGLLEVDSAVGRGTVLRVELPLDRCHTDAFGAFADRAASA
ncbi:MAG TPA: sensor histidine kinase [Steroidobacteraceae bacterium]|nr:sensor histidine kinase [Steroidobacteraceae bacterium]